MPRFIKSQSSVDIDKAIARLKALQSKIVYSNIDPDLFASAYKQVMESREYERQRVVLRKRGRIQSRKRKPISSGQDQVANDFNKAWQAFSANDLLQDPFWQNQFALKKAQREHIFENYHLMTADDLKKDCFPGWGASDPVAALNKRAERNQALSIMEDGQRLYPIEQFEFKADVPKLTSAFSDLLKAFADNGDVTQEEMLYWLSAPQPLLLPADSLIDDAIDKDNLGQGWDALKEAGPSEQSLVCPLEYLIDGDSDTALRLFYDWTEFEQDSEVHTKAEAIDAVKQFMAIERISIDDLRQG